MIPTFEEAFAGKKSNLSKKLRVTSTLLLKLDDHEIVQAESCTDIRNIARKSDKVAALLEVLQQSDDSYFVLFCKILIEDGQLHVVKIMFPNDDDPVWNEILPLEVHLKGIIELDYELPGQLYSVGVISHEERDKFKDRTKKIHDRVGFMLQAVKKNSRKKELADADSFLRALQEVCQEHVVNFIKENGHGKHKSIRLNSTDYGDDWPLVDQQRRRLSDCKLLDKITPHNEEFQDLLLKEHVISKSQKDDVMNITDECKANGQLLRVLERRSVKDVKRFIVCLMQTGQKAAVDCLCAKGVVVKMITRLKNQEICSESRQTENMASQCLNEHVHENGRGYVFDVDSYDYEVISLSPTQSLVLYIACRSLESLDRLRLLYVRSRDQLEHILLVILSTLCGCDKDYPVKLSVTWTTDDYESCKTFIRGKAGRPFGNIDCTEDSSEVNASHFRTIRDL